MAIVVAEVKNLIPCPSWYDEDKIVEALKKYFSKEDMGISWSERDGYFEFGEGCTLGFYWDKVKGKIAFGTDYSFCDFPGDRVNPPSYDSREAMTVYKVSEIEMAMSDAECRTDPEYGQPEYDPTDY